MTADVTRSIIETICFVDDSDDEAFLTRVLMESQNIRLKIRHYPEFETFFSDLTSRAIDNFQHCIAVIDLNLTVIKGTEGVRRIRQDDMFSDLIVGICTGSEDPADRMNAEQAGADFFVPKPLDYVSLSAMCDAVPSLNLARSGGGHIAVERVAEM